MTSSRRGYVGGVDSIHVLLLHAYMPVLGTTCVRKVRSGLRFTSVVEVGGMVSPKRVYLY